MARKYRIEGTKDFLYVAVVLLALGFWGLKDGWFPSEAVLKKHPQATVITAAVSGELTKLPVVLEQIVTEDDLVADISVAGGKEYPVRTKMKGTIIKVMAKEGAEVSVGQELVVVDPKDSFYIFNKSLAFICLLAGSICAYIHTVVH